MLDLKILKLSLERRVIDVGGERCEMVHERIFDIVIVLSSTMIHWIDCRNGGRRALVE